MELVNTVLLSKASIRSSPRPMSGQNTFRPGSPNKQQGQGSRGPNPSPQGTGYVSAKPGTKELAITTLELSCLRLFINLIVLWFTCDISIPRRVPVEVV